MRSADRCRAHGGLETGEDTHTGADNPRPAAVHVPLRSLMLQQRLLARKLVLTCAALEAPLCLVVIVALFVIAAVVDFDHIRMLGLPVLLQRMCALELGA